MGFFPKTGRKGTAQIDKIISMLYTLNYRTIPGAEIQPGEIRNESKGELS